VRVEAVSVASPQALAGLLEERGLAPDAVDLRALKPHTKKGWVIVLAWPEAGPAREAAGGRRRTCVSVEFPAERPFCPVPALADGPGQAFELRAWVLGHVRPDAGKAAMKQMQYSHFRENASSTSPRAVQPFWQDVEDGVLDCTAVSFDGPARALKGGLWFERVRVRGFGYAALVGELAENAPGLVLLLFVAAVLSYLSSGLTGLAMFQEWHRYAALGLWNMLTVVGFTVAVVVRLPKDRHHPLPRKLGFALVSTCTFIFLSFLLELVLMMPLL
jgi:hypothetical protein